MKRYYYSIFAAATMLFAATSCSQEESFAPEPISELTTFKVSLEGVAQSRAAVTDGITVADGMTANKLYYEVYQGKDATRKKVLDSYLAEDEPEVQSPTITSLGDGKFEVSMPLLRGEYYDILFWAQAADGSIYNPTDLTDIKVDYDNAEANTEAYDAFFYGQRNFRVTNNETTIELNRPFAQLNVGTTKSDWEQAIKVVDESNLPVTHSQVHVTGLATHFNVLDGEAFGDGADGQTFMDVTFTQDELVGQFFQAKDNDYYYLAMNYLLVPGKVVKDAEGNVTKEAKSTTDVTATFYRGEDNELFTIGALPTVSIQRNWRTNILGNLLADNKTFQIVIDSEFENDYNKEIEIYADGIVKDEDGNYRITKVEGLWAFANLVNNGYTPEEGRAATDGTIDFTFKGKTFILDNNIDLQDKPWTPIVNFAGTFDGNNKTISNLNVSVEDKASAGLFANIKGNIKNVIVDGATISGHYKAGVIVGDGLCARIENCHVKNANVTIIPLEKDDANHAGGIVGYLSGEPEAYVKNCSVENSTISAYRDVAAIAGTANQAAEVSGNIVKNVTVIADQTPEYKEIKVANADAIAGRRSENATIQDNTIGEGVEVYVKVSTAANAQFQIENATGNFNIQLGADIEGDVMIHQKQDVNITIDGLNHKYDGTIKIHNGSNYNSGALLIKDVNFETSVSERNFIMPNEFGVENGVTRRYSQNVTVEGCTFTATGDAKKTAVGVQAKSSTNLQVLNCTATDMHSLLQAQSCGGDVIVKNASINGKNGVAFKQVKNAVVEGSTIVAAEYGIRFDGNTADYGITVKDNNVTANQPFIVRKMTGANNTIALEGNNTLNAGETFQIVITKGNDDETYSTPTGTYTLTGAEGFKVYEGGEQSDYARVCKADDLNAALNNSKIKTIELGAGEFGIIVAKDNKTIIGSANAKVDAVNLNGAANVTLKNIKFDAATAKMGCDGKGKGKQYANIVTGIAGNNPIKGAMNLVIDGCTFEGTFANGGAAICFADQNRTSGGSGNVTIKNCTFNTASSYYDIYGHYTGNGLNGYGDFVIENNTFKSETQSKSVYLGRYASSTPVVVKDNIFETKTSLEAAVYVQDHSDYGVSVNALDNTFAN